MLTVFCILVSCEKYEKDINYATLKGSLVDAFTNSNLDVGNITLSPAQVTNGSMVLDTAGNFVNTRILPGEYKVYGSIKAAFKSDSVSVSLRPGGEASAVLKIEPWISLSNSVDPVKDTTVTVHYRIQGNRGVVPSKHLVVWSSSPNPTSTVYTNPTNARHFITPVTGSENGSFTYIITGLRPNTVYFIRAGATTEDASINPSNEYNYGRQMVIKTGAKP